MHRFRASNGTPPSHPRDLVYVSFGSEAPESHWFPGLYRDAIEALADFPVLLTIGDRRDPAEFGPLPRRVRVERWVAQDEVMPRAAAVVGHGGSGSTLTALAAGVPLALVPLFVDGPENARRVAGRRGRRSWSTTRPRSRPPCANCSTTRATSTLRGGSRTRSRALPPVDEAVEVLTRDRRAARRSASFASSNSISKMPSIVALKKIRVVSLALTSFMMS